MFTSVTGLGGHCRLGHRPAKIFFSLRHSISRGLAHKRQLVSHANQQKRCHRHQITAASVTEKSTTSTDRMAAYEAVIGIECHIQLSTKTKAFCRCKNEYGAPPNTHVCPVCLGHPGTLPVLNEEVLRKAVLAGLALDCNIASRSNFDRKQYFYPDLPKGYQVTQSETPIAAGGSIEIALPDGKLKRIGITRAHLEEDAGKLTHSGADQISGSDYSLVDYNRAGVPLLEVVTEPDMRSGVEAAAYGSELRRIVTFLAISNGNMQDGSMRCDVNVSVRPKEQARFGRRVEIKNMNSFSAMQRAIEFEINRQVGLVEQGLEAEIVQETRLFDEGKQITYPMRTKEGLADYRYFPEPDLPAVNITDAFLQQVKEDMEELPEHIRQRFRDLKLPAADVLVLADELAVARYFDHTLAAGASPKAAANWIMGDITAFCKESKTKMDAIKLSPATLAEMTQLIEDGTISGKIGKQILPHLLQGAADGGVKEYVESQGLAQISDTSQIGEMLDKIIEAHPKELEQFRSGKTKIKGYFSGLAMKESKGRMNPGVMDTMLAEKLKG